MPCGRRYHDSRKKHCRERENEEKLVGKGETWSQKSRSYGPPLAVGQRRQSPLKGSKKAVWSPREEDTVGRPKSACMQ